MDYDKLKTKVTAVRAEHADWTDQQIADELNAAKVPVLESIPSTELLAWSAAEDRFYNIEVCANGDPKPIRSIAKVALLLISRDGTSLDLNLPDRVAFVDTLVAEGVLTVADKASLYTLATRTVSWAESEGFGVVREGHVQQAKVME